MHTHSIHQQVTMTHVMNKHIIVIKEITLIQFCK